MNFFVSAIVTPPEHLPVTVTAAQTDLARAVTEELERLVLWRAVVHQTRRIWIDGPLPERLEIEPASDVVSIARWTSADAAVVVPATTYSVVTRDPAGTIIAPSPGSAWPSPARTIGSFTITYEAGWLVTPESSPGAGDAANLVPPSVQLMISKAIDFRAGSGLGNLTIGSLTMESDPTYKTDRLPPAILSIGRSWAYRPSIFASRP